MVFSSLSFLLFLFICLVIQHFCPSIKAKNTVLLIFSLIFYLWGGIGSLILVVAVAAADWYAAGRIAQQRNRAQRRTYLAIAVGLNVLVFALGRFWKLFPWAGDSDPVSRFAIPMGLAFYTLQLISYLVDVYRGDVQPQKRFTTLLLYTALFSQSSGGPIVRYPAIRRELNKRKVKSVTLSRGIVRFSCGLAKKVILADACGAAVASLLGDTVDTLAAAPVLAVWLGGIFFMLQLYLDLSGYADMAIGLGLMLGFHFPENFNYPYMASTLSEFWSRWNQTVIGFFRDYVYLPLGGERHGAAVEALNLVITGLLFGLWAGGTANAMLCAIYCVALLLLERLLLDRLAALPAAVGHIWVLFTMFLGFMLFRYSDLGMLATAFKGLIGLNGAGFVTVAVGQTVLRHLLLLVLSVIACTPAVPMAGNYLKEHAQEGGLWLGVKAAVDGLCPALLLLLSVAAMVGNQIPDFIFFEF